MKTIGSLIILLSLVVACSKPNSQSAQVVSNKNENLDVLSFEQKIDLNNNTVDADFSELNLGAIPQNLPAQASIVIQNKGSAPQNLNIVWEGANLQFVNNCPLSLEVRRSCVINLKVDANNIPVSSNLVGFLSVNESIYPVSGSIASPIINKNLVINALSFGNIEARRQKDQKIIISNKGDDADIVVDQSSLGSHFSILQNSCPSKLRSRASCFIDIRAASQSVGAQSSILKVSNVDVSISANFIAYNPVVSVIPSISLVDLGTSNGTNLQKFTISYFNHSFFDLNPLQIDMPSFFSVENNTCVGSLRSRKPCKVTFVVDASLMSESLDYEIKLKESDVKESLPVSVLFNLTNPTLTASLPPYSKEMTTTATLVTDFADYIKVSNNQDCSDGDWIPFSSSLSVSLINENTTNIKYFKPRKGLSNEGLCVSASTIHDNVLPQIVYSQPVQNMYLLNPTNLNSLNYSFLYNINEINQGVSELFTYADQNCGMGELSALNLNNLSVNKNTFRSVKVKHTDLAGNTSELCSPWVFAVEPVSLVASLPAYSKNLNADISLSSAQATEMKISSNASCSDGSWEPFFNIKNVSLNANQINNFWVQARREIPNLSPCMAVSTIQDNIDPVITFTNSLSQDLNRIGSSTSFDFPFNVTDTNRSNNVQYKVYSSIGCSGSPILEDNGVLVSGSSLVSTTFNIRNYRSVKVIHTDLATRSSEVCSDYVTFGQPFTLSVPQFASSSKIYNKARLFSGNIKDKFNNNLSGIQLTIDSGEDEASAVSDASGNFSFYISGDINFNKVSNIGVKIKHSNVMTDRVDVFVSDTPGIILSGNMSVIRRSCQELAALDEITLDGSFTLDPDQDGAASEYTAYCDFDNGAGWSLAAKMRTSTSTWEYSSYRWTSTGGYINQTNYSTSSSSAESKHPAFDLEIPRKIRISNGDAIVKNASMTVTNTSNLNLPSIFSQPNETVSFSRDFIDIGLFTYNGFTGTYSGPGSDADGSGLCEPELNAANLGTDVDAFIKVNRTFSQCTPAQGIVAGSIRLGRVSGPSNGCNSGTQKAACGIGVGMSLTSPYLAPNPSVYGTSSATGFSSLWIRGVEYRNPISCSDALDRNPSLRNVGQRTILIDPDGFSFGTAAINVECEFTDNSAYRQVTSWDNTGTSIQRSASALATAAYENRLFVKATFPGVNPTSTGFDPAMGNPANLDIVAMYNMTNRTNNLIANGTRMYVFNSASNGFFSPSGAGYLFFVRSPSFARNMFINSFGGLSGPADSNVNGVLDGGENGSRAQIALFANGRAVWLTTTSDGSGSDVSSYIYARDLTNETYWIKD